MKTILGLLLAMVSCVSCAATVEKTVDISSLVSIYDRKQPVRLTLQNKSQAMVRTYVNLEVQDEGRQWTTWPFRAEDGRLGATSKIYALNPSEATTITFDVRLAELPPIPSGQSKKLAEQLKFRFRIVVLHATSDNREGEFFSQSFTIKHPYG